MHLPTFPRSMAAVRHVQTAFGGYDHRPACPEGGIYEMINGSAADSPLFATRPGRTLSYPSTGQPNGLFAAGDGLLWCAGTALYHNGEAVPGCTLTDTAKVFAELGGTVLIWPAGGRHIRQRRAELDRHGNARQQRRHRRRRARERAAGRRRGHALSRGRCRDAQRLRRRTQ